MFEFPSAEEIGGAGRPTLWVGGHAYGDITSLTVGIPYNGNGSVNINQSSIGVSYECRCEISSSFDEGKAFPRTPAMVCSSAAYVTDLFVCDVSRNPRQRIKTAKGLTI